MRAEDLALEWISARGAARRDQVREAEEALRDRFPERSSRRCFEELVQLGHVEVSPRGDRWVALPPTLLVHAQETGDSVTARIYGARSRALVETLRARAERVEFAEEIPARGPRVGTVRGRTADVSDWARAVGLGVARESGLRLLRALPTLGSLLEAAPPGVVPLHAEGLERYQPLAFGRPGCWTRHSSTDGLRPGYYRTTGHGRRRWYVVRGEGVRELRRRDERIAAEWNEIGSTLVLAARYIRRDRRLELPALGPLPVLVMRALAWPAGRLPDRDHQARWWRFREVEEPRALEAARVLGMRWEAVDEG